MTNVWPSDQNCQITKFSFLLKGFSGSGRGGGPRRDRPEHRANPSLAVLDGDYARPSLSRFKRPSHFKQTNLGVRNVFQNEDDSPLLVSSIHNISQLSGASSKDNLCWPPTFAHLRSDYPIFLIKSKNLPGHREISERPSDSYNSIRRKIKSVSEKFYLRNIREKNTESIENSSLDKFDLKDLDSKLREISETPSPPLLPDQDLTVCQTEAEIEDHKR